MATSSRNKIQNIEVPIDPKTLESLYSYSFVTGRTVRECAQEYLQYRFEQIHEEPKKNNSTFKFIDLFAGIGGMRIAFEEAGGQCVFSSEWDKFSQKTYYENFGVIPHGDITKINEFEIPDHDILVAGFPCQPFSIAGVSKKNSLGRLTGFLDKTQGTLFFDIVRILNAKRPKAFLLENVKNLMNHDKGRTYKVIRESLDELNYEVTAKVMDGQHFAPQHRERILLVGFDRNQYLVPTKFDFSNLPLPDTKLALRDILEDQVDDKYTLSEHLWQYLQDYAQKHKAKGNGFGFGMADLEGITRTLSARYHKDGSEILIPQEGKIPRRLTPRECARLQGFPDKFKIVVSDTQAYRQFGNAVVVPLITAVAKEIVHTMNRNQ
ncbi:MAG: DNA (cytosine-5-)-methyltransferase [Anaerolineaceae bacterium]